MNDSCARHVDECNNSQFDYDKERVKLQLSKKYQYEECIENNRIVLKYKKMKLVEIIDTPEDKEKYIDIIYNYIEYIKNHYSYNAAINDDRDLRKSFEREVLQKNKGKLPFFFLYDFDNRLLGTVGYRDIFTVNFDTNNQKNDGKNGNIVSFQELSSRLVMWKNTNGNLGLASYGSLSFFVTYLYALNHNKRVWYKTFSSTRDLMFHCMEYVNQYFYFTLACPTFSGNCWDLDVFMDERPTKEKIEIVRSALAHKSFL